MAQHRIILAFVVLTALLAVTPLLAAASPAAQKGLRPLRLITFSVDPATLAAQARGFFAAEGVDVTITITPNSTEQMRGLGQGTWDIASTGFDNVLAWSGRDGGPPIVGVLQPTSSIYLPLYVRPEIQDWNDLRGKPLAVDAVDTAFALVLRRILLAHDLDLERGDYTLVPEGATPSRLESMMRGDTFAAILSTDLEERARAAGLRRMADHREVLPDYAPGVFAVTRPWAQQHRDELLRFLRAWLAANRWVGENRAAAIELVIASRNTSRDTAAQIVDERSPDGVMNLPGLDSVLGLRTLFGYPLPMGNDLAAFLDVSYHQQVVGR
jgi:ABC-type nitrate/sulfonate/bicarbonate transport system substrate-binding protein